LFRLSAYALTELDRCANNLNLKGLKQHFDGSAVDLRNEEHVTKVRRILEGANRHRLPILVHVRADSHYGREHAEVLLNEILPAAADVPVQIAHLWGGGGFSEAALVAYATALSAQSSVTENLYFDVAEVARVIGGQEQTLKKVSTLIRQMGIPRILYGSDGPVFGNVQPREA
jgi:predicted TIM-barrel fold metal-dependent hydrolase